MYNLINLLNNTSVQFNTLQELFRYISKINEVVCFIPRDNAIEYRGTRLDSYMIYSIAVKYQEAEV